MNKTITQFKSVIQGVESYFHFDVQCPTVIAKEALLECLQWIMNIENAAKAAQEAQDTAQPPTPDEPKPEGDV